MTPYSFLRKYAAVNVDKHLHIDNGFFLKSPCNPGGYQCQIRTTTDLPGHLR